MINLCGKVAWVTGGSEGLGASMVNLFHELGASVAITGLHEESVAAAIARIAGKGAAKGQGEVEDPRLLGVPGDVSDAAAMERAVDRILTRWGKLDIVVANAGTNGTWGPLEKIEVADWRKTIEVNLIGTYLTIRAALPAMKGRGEGGSILIVSSVNGTRTFSNEGASAYAASKAAQLALGQMLALELASFKIRVNVICPGAFDTGIHDKTKRIDLDEIEVPMEFPEGSIPLTHGDMGRPRQVAQLAAFLVSDAASHITGTPVWIDGGSSLLT